MARRVEIDDFARIRYVSDPRISPDGGQIAYVVTEILLDEKRYRSRIWLARSDDASQPVELTRGEGKDTSPRWSPDGRSLAFLTDRWGKNQIARIDLDGGEAQQVSDLYDGVIEFDWTSSGRGFLVAARADADHTLKHASDVEEPGDDDDPPVRRITTLEHKADGSGFGDGRRTQIAVVHQSGRITPLTSGDFDYTHPTLSPCRRYLAFASNQSENRDNERVTDIWVMDLDTDSTRRLTAGDGVYGLPVFSPDSRKLAFVGHPVSKPFGPTRLDQIWVADLEQGTVTSLAGEIDREMSNTCTGDSSYGAPAQRPVWARDGASLYSLMSDQGRVSIVRVFLSGANEVVAGGDREVKNLSVAVGGRIAFAVSNPCQPAEIFVQEGESGTEHQITRHNQELIDQLELVHPRRMQIPAEDGTGIDAWLLEPAGRVDGVKYPLLLEIHGGPHAMCGATYMHEFQVLAAQGYGVLYTNPRGSTGYGQEFVSAAMGDWGGVDYRDIMSALNGVLEGVDWVDSRRLGVTGGSYGGYMVNWIISQSDRFRAAVTQRSTCNRVSIFGTSDLAWSYSSWEFRGLPWEEPDYYLDRSPISYVDRVTTPVLIMHSERDLRCPVEQSEQWFTALKRLGRTTEFVRFPDESHNLSRSGRPDRRRERFMRIVDWFGRWL